MDNLKVGDRIKDNDPRMPSNRVLTIVEIIAGRVAARDSIGSVRHYQRSRIYTDGKPRRTGFSLVRDAQAGSDADR